jgi:hypothetical protein
MFPVVEALCPTSVLYKLVTAVFVVSPSTLLESLTGGNVKAWIWMVIILVR